MSYKLRYQYTKESRIAFAAATVVPPHNDYQQYTLIDGKWLEGDFALSFDQILAAHYPYAWLKYAIQQHPTLEFCLLGCHGIDTYAYAMDRFPIQKKITAAMSENHENSLINFILGDNFYHWGVDSEKDTLFERCFYKHFLNKPSLVALGNHDYNIHGQALPGIIKHPFMRGIERAMFQVTHSYSNHSRKEALRTRNTWNMPFRYYTSTSDKWNVHFVTIDSNTILFDKAQQQWLCEQYEDLARRNTDCLFVLISHHPLQYFSKRANKGIDNLDSPEWKKYVQSSEATLTKVPSYWPGNRFEAAGTEIPNCSVRTHADARNTVGKCIRFLLEHYNLKFKVEFAAHEHLMAYKKIDVTYQDGTVSPMHQFISGGGGAKLNKPLDDYKEEKRNADRSLEEKVWHNWGYMHATIGSNILQVTPYILRGNQASDEFTEQDPILISWND